jgi:hypothetical protein
MPDERTKRWGVELRGHSFDLEDWEDDLKPPFDPSVVALPNQNTPDVLIRVLQSTSFEACTSPSDVREIAVPLVRTLSGLIGVRRGAMPVTIGTVLEFRADGSWNSYAFIEGAHLVGRSKARGVGVVVIGGVPQEPAPPTASYAQSLIEDLSDDLRSALRYYDMADNWYDLYKSYEAVLSHLNPRNDARAMDKLKKLGFTHQELKGLKGSPQHYRHHKTDAPLVFNLNEAKALTRRILDAVLQSGPGPLG